jgi:hypothetical protein
LAVRDRVWAIGGGAIAVLGLAGALSGCAAAAGGSASLGSQPGMHAPSSSPNPSLPGSGGGPNIPVVELNNSFSPSTLRIGVGQQFELFIGKRVNVSGLSVAGCASGQPVPLPGGLLSVQCKPGGGYMYSAEHAGTATLSATVRPRCSAGTMCPQWVAEPALKVTISS